MNLIFNRITLLLVLLTSGISFTGCNKQNSVKTEQLVNNGAFLVDVRTPQEFAAGHVVGSVNIPVDEIGKNLEKFKDKDNIIVFCRSGARAETAKDVLQKNGVEHVTNGGNWEDINKMITDK